MIIERDADDVARCFALEQLLFHGGFDRTFAGEVSGLIGAGAFVAFSPEEADDATASPPYEGLLPVRRMQGVVSGTKPADGRQGRGAAAAGRSPGSRATRGPGRAGGGRGGQGQRSGGGEGPAPEREWWDLNEEGTILYGSRTGAALRLGDPVRVRVHRVDTVRGRVDLGP